MGGGPQQPRTQYPGAEYFALAPNRDVALGPRLSLQALTSGAITVPPNLTSQQVVGIQVRPTFVSSQGIYIVRAQAVFVPSDASGQLRISGARMGLGNSTPLFIYLDLGLPLLTFASPTTSQIAILDQNDLIVGADLRSFPPNTPLWMWWQVAAQNTDGVASHSFDVQGYLIFHSLDGFVA